MGYAADSNLERDSRLVEMRQAARSKTLTGFGNAQAGTSGENGRALPDDVRRHLELKRGRAVLARPGESGVDISSLLRQLQREAEPVRTLHQHAEELRGQYKSELAGQVLSFADDLDPNLAAEIVSVLNQD